MPRIADQGLEERILRAAQRLWRARGEAGLTLRAVARAAGTTTTTVYKRFRNREALCFALADRVRAELAAVIVESPSIQQAYRRYLALAEKHPHEYKLLWGSAWPQVLGPHRPRPVREWLLARLVERFGGRPDDYDLLFHALLLTSHGTATLLASSRDMKARARIRRKCLAICDTLVDHSEVLRGKG